MNRFVLLLLLTVFLGNPMVHSREPTPAEMEAISKETRLVFESFLQLWQEERYFEMYDYGKKQSREILSLEEFATRMVELDWVPVGLSPEKPSEISYRYRTLLYMNANIVFRHKSFYDLQFTKPKAFLLQKEEGAWKFDLIQMIRSPYYSPENS
ncbi:MAG: hypothetical protein VX844_07600 [SAR324 cluster bacterium]|nr:hypothetical protein [SAR324 cluster bacterium]